MLILGWSELRWVPWISWRWTSSLGWELFLERPMEVLYIYIYIYTLYIYIHIIYTLYIMCIYIYIYVTQIWIDSHNSFNQPTGKSLNVWVWPDRIVHSSGKDDPIPLVKCPSLLWKDPPISPPSNTIHEAYQGYPDVLTWGCLPSGKLSHNYGKSPFLMGIHQRTFNGHFQ